MSYEYDVKHYEALASIDEEMTRIKTTANTLKNAEDKDKTLTTLTVISEYISNIRKMYNNLEIIEMEGDEQEDDEEPDANGYADGTSFLKY